MDKRFGRMLPLNTVALLLLVALFAGCATTQVSGPAKGSSSAAFVSAGQLAHNHAALAGQAKTDNAREIERLLSAIDNDTLTRDAAALPVGDPLYAFAGQALLKRGLPLPRPFDRSANWRFDLNDRPAADRDGYRPPVKLAVLLPLSGQLATASAPVRDGLLAGYYGENRRRPEITFYDTAGTPVGAIDAYGKAAAAGADFIIGPLGRDEVSAVFRESSLAVPTLALNRGVVTPPPGNAGFSLAPEDDGIAAAEYLLSRERKTALVIGGNDDNGKRGPCALQRTRRHGGGYAERGRNSGRCFCCTFCRFDTRRGLGVPGVERQHGPLDCTATGLDGIGRQEPRGHIAADFRHRQARAGQRTGRHHLSA